MPCRRCAAIAKKSNKINSRLVTRAITKRPSHLSSSSQLQIDSVALYNVAASSSRETMTTSSTKQESLSRTQKRRRFRGIMPSFITGLRLLTVSALMVVLAGFNQGCPSTPRPQITISPSTDAINGPPRVSAHVIPNQFPVTEVILEFGRRPSTANAVNILYSSESSSYNLPRNITRNLTTRDPFDVTFTFNISKSGPN